MGYLLNGAWKDGWHDTGRTGGEFIRPEAQFRNRITADGSSGYPAEPGRYHLYVSLACPWAHRTLIFRKLKNLEDAISVSVVEPGTDEWEAHAAALVAARLNLADPAAAVERWRTGCSVVRLNPPPSSG